MASRDDIFLTFVLEDEENLIPREHPVTLDLISPRGQLVERQNHTARGTLLQFGFLETSGVMPNGSRWSSISVRTGSNTLTWQTCRYKASFSVSG